MAAVIRTRRKEHRGLNPLSSTRKSKTRISKSKKKAHRLRNPAGHFADYALGGDHEG